VTEAERVVPTPWPPGYLMRESIFRPILRDAQAPALSKIPDTPVQDPGHEAAWSPSRAREKLRGLLAALRMSAEPSPLDPIADGLITRALEGGACDTEEAFVKAGWGSFFPELVTMLPEVMRMPEGPELPPSLPPSSDEAVWTPEQHEAEATAADGRAAEWEAARDKALRDRDDVMAASATNQAELARKNAEHHREQAARLRGGAS
jgi:hypothetical protein